MKKQHLKILVPGIFAATVFALAFSLMTVLTAACRESPQAPSNADVAILAEQSRPIRMS